MRLHLIPWAIDRVWHHYATRASGQEATSGPVRGADRATALRLERAVIDAATTA